MKKNEILQNSRNKKLRQKNRKKNLILCKEHLKAEYAYTKDNKYLRREIELLHLIHNPRRIDSKAFEFFSMSWNYIKSHRPKVNITGIKKDYPFYVTKNKISIAGAT